MNSETWEGSPNCVNYFHYLVGTVEIFSHKYLTQHTKNQQTIRVEHIRVQ